MSASTMRLPIFYYGRYGKSDLLHLYHWERKRSEVLKILRRNLPHLFPNAKPGKHLMVDLGCGRGEDLILYKGLIDQYCPGVRYVGVDVQFNEIESLHRKAGIEHLVCNFAKTIPYEDGQIDLLYCSEVIEHIPEPETLLREIRRVLKPTGHLILTTPNTPLFFQRSYWSSAHHKKVIEEGLAADNANPTFIDVNGESVRVYGHISVRTTREWDAILRGVGLLKVDGGRSSFAYGCENIFRNPFAVLSFFLVETALDLVPRALVQGLCCQLIGLYCMA